MTDNTLYLPTGDGGTCMIIGKYHDAIAYISYDSTKKITLPREFKNNELTQVLPVTFRMTIIPATQENYESLKKLQYSLNATPNTKHQNH